MKNKQLIELVENLVNHFAFYGLKYSLSINYERIVNDYNSTRTLTTEEVPLIIEMINSKSVNNFNFSLHDKIQYDFESDDPGYWYDLNYIFYSDKDKILCQLSFSSSMLSLINGLPTPLDANEDGVNRLKGIADTYLKCSKDLYSVMRGI